MKIFFRYQTCGFLLVLVPPDMPSHYTQEQFLQIRKKLTIFKHELCIDLELWELDLEAPILFFWPP